MTVICGGLLMLIVLLLVFGVGVLCGVDVVCVCWYAHVLLFVIL